MSKRIEWDLENSGRYGVLIDLAEDDSLVWIDYQAFRDKWENHDYYSFVCFPIKKAEEVLTAIREAVASVPTPR